MPDAQLLRIAGVDARHKRIDGPCQRFITESAAHEIGDRFIVIGCAARNERFAEYTQLGGGAEERGTQQCQWRRRHREGATVAHDVATLRLWRRRTHQRRKVQHFHKRCQFIGKRARIRAMLNEVPVATRAAHHATDHLIRLEHRHIGAEASQIPGRRQSGQTGTTNENVRHGRHRPLSPRASRAERASPSVPLRNSPRAMSVRTAMRRAAEGSSAHSRCALRCADRSVCHGRAPD